MLKPEERSDTTETTAAPPVSPASTGRGGAVEAPGRDVLFVGVDLGTSRSAVAASNGVREMMPSVVGWPKDTVAQKVHGKRTVFGEEAINNRLSLDIVWPLADGNLVYPSLDGEPRERARRAAEELVDELRRLASPLPGESIYTVIGAPAEATKENKQALIEIARSAGIDSVMVVSEPFAVAYAVDALEEAIVIDVGAGTIDLCRMAGALPTLEDQITVFRAGNFIDEEISTRVRESHPEAQFSPNMIKMAKERFSAVTSRAERAVVKFPVQGVPTLIDITDAMRDAVSLIVPELVEGIRKLVASFDPEFQERIRGRVFISGGGSQIYGLRDAIEKGMEKIGGGRVFLVDEPVFAGASGALKLAQEMPMQYWETLREL